MLLLSNRLSSDRYVVDITTSAGPGQAKCVNNTTIKTSPPYSNLTLRYSQHRKGRIPIFPTLTNSEVAEINLVGLGCVVLAKYQSAGARDPMRAQTYQSLIDKSTVLRRGDHDYVK